MLPDRIVLCCLLTTFAVATSVRGEDTVIVELRNGKQLRAQTLQPDPDRPDRVRLVSVTARIRMERAIAWSQVRHIAATPAAVEGVSIPDSVTTSAPRGSFPPALQVRDSLPPVGVDAVPVIRPVWVTTAIPDGPCGELIPVLVPVSPGVVVGVRNAATGQGVAMPEPATSAPAPQDDPIELMLDVRPVNRQGLADWDSLELTIAGRTRDGRITRVRGSLGCTLWGQNAQLVRSAAEDSFDDRRDLVRIAHWSRFLDASREEARATIVLPLPPQNPEHTTSLGTWGLVAVTLDIPGQGRLAKSVDGIPLRQSGPIRSRALSDFGTSLIPGESTSTGLSPSGDWPAPLSGIRPDRRRFSVEP